MRESSGRSTSSKRPVSSCSSSVTRAWKRRPLLVDLDDVAGADALRGRAAGRGRRTAEPPAAWAGGPSSPATLCGGSDGLPDAAVQIDVLLAVGADADDRGALGGDGVAPARCGRSRRPRRAPSRRRRARRRGRSRARAASRCARRTPRPRAPRAGSGRCRRRRCRSARSRASARAARRRAGRRRRGRARRRRSAGRPARARRPRRRTRSRPSRRSRSRRGWRAPGTASSRAGKNVSTSRTGIEEATTSVGRPAAARLPSSAATRGSVSPAGPTAVGDRARRGPVGGVPAVEPARVLALARQRLRRARRASCAGRRRRSSRRRRPGPARPLSGSKLTCSASRPASHVRSGLEVGRSPTRSTRSGRVRARPRPHRAAARRSARSPRARGGRPTAARPAAARPPARRTRPAPRPAADRAPARPATTSTRGAPCSSSSSPSSSRGRGLAQRARPRHPRPPARAPGCDLDVGHAVGRRAPAARAARSSGAPGPGRPRPRSRTRGRRAGAASARARGARRVVVDLEVPLGGAAVELDLVDRLPGADVAQLRRAVGGQHEQRHARLVRLDHRGRVVGRGGAPTCRPARRERRSSSPARARRTPRSARRCATSRAAAARARASAPAASSASRARCTRRAARSGRARRRRHAGRDRCRFRA